MPDLPTGTVTFLFTDIEGSTRLWEQHPEAMAAGLVRHDLLLRAAIETYHGHVFKTIGDAFCAAFASPLDATQAAVSAQRTLHTEVRQLQVRMAIHTGEAEARDGDYFGPALNRVARLLAAGHGGQVLLSQAAAEQLRPTLPSDASLRSLGAHRLRDIVATETVFQLLLPGLPSRFPPLNTLNVAFRRGMARASAIAGVVLLVMLGLTTWAVQNGRAAERNAIRANAERRNANRNAARATQEARRADRNAARARGQATLAEHRRETAVQALRDRQTALNEAIAQRRRADDNAKAERHAAAHARVAAERERIAAAKETHQRRLAVERELTAQRNLYGAHMNLAQQAWEGGNVRRALELLQAQRPQPRQEDRRGFDWRYLWRLCQGDTRLSFPEPWGRTLLRPALFSPDGKILAIGDANSVTLRDPASGRALASFEAPSELLAFSPSGKVLATRHYDQNTKVWDSVKLWDVATRRALASLQTHQTPFGIIAFSPDGRILASVGEDTTIKLWDVVTTREVTALKGDLHRVDSLAFSSGGKILASGGGKVNLWDPKTGQMIAMIVARYPLFSPDGSTLAAVTSEDKVMLWDVTTRRVVATSQGETRGITCLAYSPDGHTLATGSDDNVKLWDAVSGRELASLAGHTLSITSVAFSANGKTVASSSVDNTIKLWDVDSRREMTMLRGHASAVVDVTFSPDGETLLSKGGDAIKVWELVERHVPAMVLSNQASVNSLWYSPDGKMLAAASWDGLVRLLDAKNGQVRFCLKQRSFPVLAFSPDGRLIATAGQSGAPDAAQLWEIASGRLKATLTAHRLSVKSLAFSPDGRLLATGGGQGDQTVHLWDARTGQLYGILKGRRVSGLSLAFSPDGTILAVPNQQGAFSGGIISGIRWSVTLWSVPSRRAMGFLPDAAEALFLPGGKTLAVKTHGDDPRLWDTVTIRDVVTHRLVATLRGPGQWSGPWALCPDGKVLAMSSGRTITLWNLTSKQQVVSLTCPTGVEAVAFSPDGGTLSSASTDGSIRLWRAASFGETDPVRPPGTRSRDPR